MASSVRECCGPNCAANSVTTISNIPRAVSTCASERASEPPVLAVYSAGYLVDCWHVCCAGCAVRYRVAMLAYLPEPVGEQDREVHLRVQRLRVLGPCGDSGTMASHH